MLSLSNEFSHATSRSIHGKEQQMESTSLLENIAIPMLSGQSVKGLDSSTTKEYKKYVFPRVLLYLGKFVVLSHIVVTVHLLHFTFRRSPENFDDFNELINLRVSHKRWRTIDHFD